MHGPYENYRTPEQRVPDERLPYPWETCMSMSQSWSWVAEPQYKSVRELVHTLVDVVAKGGNLLLNVGPDARGRWDPEAYEQLAGVGDWMEVNGEAIHGTRPVEPYAAGSVRYTRRKGTDTVYAVYLAPPGASRPPAEIELDGVRPRDAVRLLETGAEVPWTVEDGRVRVRLPEEERRRLRVAPAWTLVFELTE